MVKPFSGAFEMRHVFRFPSRFQLFQRPDHLRFRVPAFRHAYFPFPSSEIILSFIPKEGSMSKSNHTEAQMIGALKQLEAGRVSSPGG